MIALLEWLWFVLLLILTGYYLVIFRRKPDVRMIPILNWPGVSIIIAHKNDTEGLGHNLALIQKQDYPLFEIIIIDDHSNTQQKMILDELVRNYSKIRWLLNEGVGKKHAITLGVQNAEHELILCTDADCKPVSDHWIKKMVEAGRGDVVLGYSPVEKKNGWLNMLVRFETVCTGMNYISWATSGKP